MAFYICFFSGKIFIPHWRHNEFFECKTRQGKTDLEGSISLKTVSECEYRNNSTDIRSTVSFFSQCVQKFLMQRSVARLNVNCIDELKDLKIKRDPVKLGKHSKEQQIAMFEPATNIVNLEQGNTKLTRWVQKKKNQ